MRRVVVAITLLLGVVAAGAAFSGIAVWGRLHDPYKGYAGAEQFVVIAPGTGTAAIRRKLVDAGVIRDPLAFRAAVWWTGRAREIQAGEYRFDRPLAAVDVVERLARGSLRD